MKGLFRAELLRLRKRRSLQVIVLGAPLLMGVLFVLGYASIYHNEPFDAAGFRAQLIADGYVIGLPPEEAEALLDQTVEEARRSYAMSEEGEALQRAGHLFPYSLATVLGSGLFVLMAMFLLTVTTVGDELSWGTIRTTLLASGHRRRVLVVRFCAMAVAGVVMLALALVVGAILPFVLGVAAARLPATLPPFDFGALAVLVLGLMVAGGLLVGFAALAVLTFRSGPLALISIPVYIAVEAAVLLALLRFPNIGGDPMTGEPGPDAWILDVFPLHGLTTLLTTAARSAIGFANYPGEPISRDLSGVQVPIVSFVIAAVVFGALAFRRFQRMDIVE
jgi:ABC-type transport system involved in multi-copper enzyme maturation permease subunit